MSDNEDSTDWRMLREFAAVDLAKSFVLSWEIEAGTLLVDIDLYLTPEHPFYEKPRPAEGVCVRPAVIEFPCCERLKTDGDTERVDVQDATLKLKPGAISGLQRLADGHCVLNGDFGVVLIDAGRPILRHKTL